MLMGAGAGGAPCAKEKAWEPTGDAFGVEPAEESWLDGLWGTGVAPLAGNVEKKLLGPSPGAWWGGGGWGEEVV